MDSGDKTLIYIYIYINEHIGLGPSGALLLLHGGPGLIYMAIYGRFSLNIIFNIIFSKFI